MNVGDEVEIINGKVGTVFSSYPGTVTDVEPPGAGGRIRVLLNGWRLPMWFEPDQVKGVDKPVR